MKARNSSEISKTFVKVYIKVCNLTQLEKVWKSSTFSEFSNSRPKFAPKNILSSSFGPKLKHNSSLKN